MTITENDCVEHHFTHFSSINIGDIIRAKVINVKDCLECVFVDIGEEKKAFLEYNRHNQVSTYSKYRKDVNSKLKAGDSILVRIVKDAYGAKGVKVALDVAIAGRMIVLIDSRSEVLLSKKLKDGEKTQEIMSSLLKIKDENIGFIIRTQALDYSIEEIQKEAVQLTEKYLQLIKDYNNSTKIETLYKEDDFILKKFRDIISKNDEISEIHVNSIIYYDYLMSLASQELPNIKGKVILFDKAKSMTGYFSLREKLKEISKKQVELANGGNLIIEETQAMVTIDVNSGHYQGNSSLAATAFDINKAAAKEIARQIRLRDLSGIIIVDFIDMRDEQNKEDLLLILREEAAKDYTPTRVIGLTSLGLCEITRERKGSLCSFHKTCPCCAGRGTVENSVITLIRLREELLDLISENKVKEIGINLSKKLKDVKLDHTIFKEYFQGAIR